MKEIIGFYVFHIPCINKSYKICKDQQMHCSFKMYFYLLYSHRHVSASNPAIFRMMFLTQEYNCS